MTGLLDFSTALPVLLVFVVFFNRYFLGSFLRFTEARGGTAEDTAPEPHAVSIIIPMFNEGPSIYDTLHSLLQQDYPPELLRIVVVDDASSDRSAAWARKAAAEDPRITVLVNERNIGKRLSINRAVARVESPFVVSVDSDVLVEPDAIRRLMRGFRSKEIAAVGGRVKVSNANVNWLTKMQAVKYHFGYLYLKNLESAFHSVMCLSGCLTAYRTEVLLALEPVLNSRSLLGIAVKYGEDRFLTRQIVKAGWRTELDLEAVCYTKAPLRLADYFSQQLRWRRSNIVDFLGGITHAWRLRPLVAIHYVSLNCLLLCYPLLLWQEVLWGKFLDAASFHLGILALYALVYHWETRGEAKHLRVPALHFLWMGVLMPVTYMLLTVVAAFTLDSGSWETRGHGEQKPVQ